MRIPTDTGKIEFVPSTEQLKSFDDFTDMLKLVEAASILEKKAKPEDIDLIIKILGFMQKVYKFQSPEEKAKAEAFSKGVVFPISTHLPIYNAVCAYNRQDLALAFSHIFHDYLECDLLEVTELTEQGAVFIAFALLEQFDPTAIPNDLEAKARCQMGEFKMFAGRPMSFYNGVETKRAYQYHTLLGKSYEDSKRFKRLQELRGTPATADETISIHSPALPASNPPEKLLILKPVEQEEAEQEIIVQEVEYQEDSFLDDMSFVDADEVVDSDGVEVMDIDDDSEPEQSSEDYDWMKDIDVKKK